MPGGFVNSPPEAIQKVVRREVPDFPLDHFNAIASMYFTEFNHVAQTPAQVRSQMERIGQKATDLWCDLGTLSEEALDALFDGSAAVGVPDAESFSQALYLIMAATRHAGQQVDVSAGGRRRGALAGLVSRLASVMEALGLTADAKPRGNLVFLTERVLEGYGHSSAAVIKAVQRHMDKTALSGP